MVAGAVSATLGAEYRLVLTSRNGLLSARRAIATRWPDLIRLQRRRLQRDPRPQ